MWRIRTLAWIIIAPSIALVVDELAQHWLDPMVGSPFLAAIFLVSRFRGLRSAVAATLVSALLLDFFVLPPVFSFQFSRADLVRLGLFGLIAIVTAGLASLSKNV
jgi:two-component system sensor histidine kinase KdpD